MPDGVCGGPNSFSPPVCSWEYHSLEWPHGWACPNSLAVNDIWCTDSTIKIQYNSKVSRRETSTDL